MSSRGTSAAYAVAAPRKVPLTYAATMTSLVLLAVASGVMCWWFMKSYGHASDGAPSLGAMATYVIMWSLMMAAMMLPTVHRATVLYVTAIRRQDGSPVWMWRIGMLLAGYLFIWSVIGVPVYLVDVYVQRFIPAGSNWALWFTATLIAGSGLFQFSALKERCLHHCQSPMGFVSQYMQRTGWDRDLRAGLEHGLTCLGCCAAMVAVLVGVGTMNLPWMIVLGAIAMIEKAWPHGRRFSRIAGVGMILYAVAILLQPQWTPAPNGLDGHGRGHEHHHRGS